MLLAWTTVEDRELAEQLATDAVAEGVAVCAQVEVSPIFSAYRWKGQTQTAREFRILFKCLPEQQKPLEQWVLARHPYEVPEWIVVRPESVGEKYLSWAKADSSNRPL
ncbi:MAG: divalent-cation tolerance protein CutA [Opitutus sp.]|nr:divalent-cation tolerance protein CutA [Opitutus sp.]